MISFTQGEILKSNLSATTDPGASNDVAQGYEVGSTWANISTSPHRVFVAVDVSVGAAVWIQTTNTIDNSDSPGLYFLGSILDYSIGAGLPVGEVQYSRVFLIAGLSISTAQVFVDSGGTAARNLRAGLYGQAVPTDKTGVPVTRLTQSDVTPTTGADGTYLTLTFTAPYAIPATGFYWVALVADSAAVKLIATGTVYRENFPPTRRQSVTGTDLPATASGLSNPVSAIAFAAATE